VYVEDLPQRIGHKAGGSDTGNKQVEVRQRGGGMPGAVSIDLGLDDDAT
jgi:hypothetical protein